MSNKSPVSPRRSNEAKASMLTRLSRNSKNSPKGSRSRSLDEYTTDVLKYRDSELNPGLYAIWRETFNKLMDFFSSNAFDPASMFVSNLDSVIDPTSVRSLGVTRDVALLIPMQLSISTPLDITQTIQNVKVPMPNGMRSVGPANIRPYLLTNFANLSLTYPAAVAIEIKIKEVVIAIKSSDVNVSNDKSALLSTISNEFAIKIPQQHNVRVSSRLDRLATILLAFMFLNTFVLRIEGSTYSNCSQVTPTVDAWSLSVQSKRSILSDICFRQVNGMLLCKPRIEPAVTPTPTPTPISTPINSVAIPAPQVNNNNFNSSNEKRQIGTNSTTYPAYLDYIIQSNPTHSLPFSQCLSTINHGVSVFGSYVTNVDLDIDFTIIDVYSLINLEYQYSFVDPSTMVETTNRCDCSYNVGHSYCTNIDNQDPQSDYSRHFCSTSNNASCVDCCISLSICGCRLEDEIKLKTIIDITTTNVFQVYYFSNIIDTLSTINYRISPNLTFTTWQTVNNDFTKIHDDPDTYFFFGASLPSAANDVAVVQYNAHYYIVDRSTLNNALEFDTNKIGWAQVVITSGIPKINFPYQNWKLCYNVAGSGCSSSTFEYICNSTVPDLSANIDPMISFQGGSPVISVNFNVTNVDLPMNLQFMFLDIASSLELVRFTNVSCRVLSNAQTACDIMTTSNTLNKAIIINAINQQVVSVEYPLVAIVNFIQIFVPSNLSCFDICYAIGDNCFRFLKLVNNDNAQVIIPTSSCVVTVPSPEVVPEIPKPEDTDFHLFEQDQTESYLILSAIIVGSIIICCLLTLCISYCLFKTCFFLCCQADEHNMTIMDYIKRTFGKSSEVYAPVSNNDNL